MQRWSAMLLGLLLAAAIVVVVLRARAPAAQPAPQTPTSARPIGSAADLLPQPDPLGDAEAPPSEPVREATGFDRMPNGAAVPELPATAPKTVSFGVILFSYKGAQSAPADAPPRAQALAKARSVLEEAKTNFHEAVKKGDRGSTPDAGRLPRGVLEPYLDYVLFALAKGAVHSEPVDTPRGYWIVKRID
jgi:PPIC-type PPIASE domain